ncbi:hypothetical protein [Pseudomonas amygdali]|uniref:Uncharacterized protein n=2 Tax=Pseudomonas amygdali pv. lachrymans TaxID=53707 RepID=A0ABR5KSZ4_PSEAV|nr:hypothetical protein [Pseudomonas amygdali]AXH59558.1 hypothetical protein PLA107_030500 [Pseudomonas amygdali pv. lachrymans str. M301315]KPC16986.1 Uncharacterized protein AC499_0188 [Pseudomonas amygdali pv. lachrymans]KPC17945.1 Uncharacterized protein AC499_1147 [Pseudomonas amygdali pv. lachrymans]RMT06059.1 hypothetical protein ALP54_03480 [Pseudomonas amygdali pv. lachrymans]
MQNKTEITLQDLRNLEARTREGVQAIREILEDSQVDRARVSQELLAAQSRLAAQFAADTPATTPGVGQNPPEELPSQRKTVDLLKTLGSLASDLESAARELRGVTRSIEVDQDVSRTTEACEIITNLLGNLRLDKLTLLPYQVLELRLLEQRIKTDAGTPNPDTP